MKKRNEEKIATQDYIARITTIKHSNNGAEYLRSNNNSSSANGIVDEKYIKNDDISEELLDLLRNFNLVFNEEHKEIEELLFSKRSLQTSLINMFLNSENKKNIIKKKNEETLATQQLCEDINDMEQEISYLKLVSKFCESSRSAFTTFICHSLYFNSSRFISQDKNAYNPEKLYKDLNSMIENISLNNEQISNIVYSSGFLNPDFFYGSKELLSEMKKEIPETYNKKENIK